MRHVPAVCLASIASLLTLAAGCGASASPSGPSIDRTVGLACTTNAQCDVTGGGHNACSSTALPVYPAPVCIGLSCTLGSGATPAPCDGGRGVCLNIGSGPACLPACTFGNDGAAAGCLAKSSCLPASVATTAGSGYCTGACTGDIDCPGRFCQVETGQCVSARATYTMSVGTTCTQADVTNNRCLCNLGTTSGVGYCTIACVTGGGAACPTGFTCDPGLSSAYTGLASGLVGECLKNCASAADCPSPIACVQDGGGIGKVCKPA